MLRCGRDNHYAWRERRDNCHVRGEPFDNCHVVRRVHPAGRAKTQLLSLPCVKTHVHGVHPLEACVFAHGAGRACEKPNGKMGDPMTQTPGGPT
ncbi:MAG: hypothetical protein Kow00109_04400 [Acidobacteriota bacterium]